MENKKLISTRLDPQTLQKIEKFIELHYYWKRNTVISGVLDAVFDNFDEKAIYDMVRYWRGHHNNAKGTFSLEKLSDSLSAANDQGK
mgnify:CR=1 FL=1